MPRAPKYCAHDDCTTLIPGGTRNCPTHTSRWPTDQRTRRTKTPEHEAWRGQVLINARHQCQLRYTGVCIDTATQADHIKPVTEGGPEFDPTNGQGACEPCHRLKSSDEGHRAQGHHVPHRPRL